MFRKLSLLFILVSLLRQLEIEIETTVLETYMLNASFGLCNSNYFFYIVYGTTLQAKVEMLSSTKKIMLEKALAWLILSFNLLKV